MSQEEHFDLSYQIYLEEKDDDDLKAAVRADMSDIFDFEGETQIQIGQREKFDRLKNQPSYNPKKMSLVAWGRWMDELEKKGVTGIDVNITHSGTERHELGIGRILHLLRKNPELKSIDWYVKTDEHKTNHLDNFLCTKEEKERFSKLENDKKYLYRADIYLYHQQELELPDGTIQTIHFDRRFIEVHGGYHDKWKQMIKDDHREDFIKDVWPDAIYMEFPIDELIPESKKRNVVSTDAAVVHKILTGEDVFE